MEDAASTQTFLEAATAGGDIDILINNVGASPSRNFLYMSDADWQSLHELNLLSAVRCTRHCLPAMRKQKWGRVVMVASGAAKYPNAALIDYGTTKAAMISMAKSSSAQVRQRWGFGELGATGVDSYRHVGPSGNRDR